MAKQKQATNDEPVILNTSIDPETGTADLPLIGSTTNFVKFGHPFERGGQGNQIAGVLYLTHDMAQDVAYLQVTLIKRKK